MQSLARQAAKEDRPGARLLIVTGQPDESLAERVQTHAEKHGVRTEWLLYRVSIELSEAK
jgi:predicted O-linked N-acetylglucosamine transferase (SPINDLY family)